MNHSNKPKLLFPDFTNDWRKVKLGNLFKFKNGLNSSKEKYGSGVKFINVLDIIENDYITYDKIADSVDTTDKEIENYRVLNGDILFQRSSETRKDSGQANVYLDDSNKDVVFGGFVIRGRAKFDYHPFFINSILKSASARKEITSKSQGSTRFNVGQDTLSEVEIFIPKLDEQKKIADFLSAIDKKIKELGYKKKLLQEYKKGAIQKLFPKVGKQSPELRFKKENGEDFPDWKTKRLGEIGKTFNGLTGKTKEDFGSGSPFISYKQVFDQSKIEPGNFDYVKIATDEDQNEVQYGDVIFTTTSETRLEVGFSSVFLEKIENVYLNSFCFGFRIHFHDELSPEFARFLFRSEGFRQMITRLGQGSTRYNLSKNEVKKLMISFPLRSEQDKVADFLTNLTNRIATLDKKIHKAQIFKKGLLQKLFV